MASDRYYAPFTYQPLNPGQIRLLLLSEQEGKPILQLIAGDHASAPPYFTLSYTWGDPPVRDHTILVNGTLLKVTKNLETLLPFLCRRYSRRYFWIDGICINQDDIPERNSQVEMFGEIYTRTITCVIWLGKSDKIIQHAILCLPSLVQKLQRYNPRLGMDEDQLKMHGIPPPTAPEWIGLQKIVTKDWFMRIWTFQEAVLPPKLEIVCGNNLVATEDLSRLATFLYSMPETGSLKLVANAVDWKSFGIRNGIERINVIKDARYLRSVQSSNQYDFTWLLGKSINWKCSNVMDKIYGLRGLADKDFQENMRVNYDRKPEDLWLEFANYWLTKDPYFQIFHFIPSAQPKQPLAYKLPSWCPDFTNLPRSTPFWIFGYAPKYRAGIKTGHITWIEKESSRVIRVEGFLIDWVVKALPCPWERQDNVDEESKAKSVTAGLVWDNECLELSKSLLGNTLGPTYGPRHKAPFWRAAQGAYRAFLNGLTDEGLDGVPDAYWRTLIANKHANGNHYSGLGREIYHLCRISTAKMANKENLLSPREQLVADMPVSTQKQVQVQDYAEAWGYASHGRSFITTERGTIGLGPEHTKPGDLICIILNGGTPFILRQTQPERYILIGESYVHGLMYGEALERADRPPNRYFTLD